MVNSDVLFDLVSLLMLTQRVQVEGEVTGGLQSVGVVFAQHPAATGQGVFVESAGLLVLTQRV